MGDNTVCQVTCMGLPYISELLGSPNRNFMKVRCYFNITCVLKMKKLKHKNVYYFAQGYMDKKLETDSEARQLVLSFKFSTGALILDLAPLGPAPPCHFLVV